MVNIEFIDVMRKQIESILQAVDHAIRQAKFDKTFKAQIVSNLGGGKYLVLFKNNEYSAKSYESYGIGTFVLVTALENNWNELYITAKISK